MHNIHAPNHASKNRMFIIQPRRLFRSNKKLTPVRILPRISHTNRIRLIMSQQRRKLVFKLATPDTFAACAVAQGVAGLDHEFADYAVEDYVVVVRGPGVRDEVFDGFGCVLGEEPDLDVPVGGV